MANNNFMGTFDSETEVLRKIEELKSQGISEDHMYVMAHDKDQISMVRGRTDVDYKSAEGGGWMDKFMGFMAGNEPIRRAFDDMGVDGQEADRYYQEVQNGKILLFVDKEIGDSYDNRPRSGSSAYGDPTNNTAGSGAAAGIVGANDTSRYTGEDSGMVGRDGLTVDTNEANDVNFHSDRSLVDADETSASSRLDDSETAGVGRDTGTGFGLGPGSSVNDVPSPSRETGDFTATNESRYGDTDRRTTGDFADRDRTDRDLIDTDRDRMDTNHDRALDTDEDRIRLHEERLQVDKDRVQTGEVNVGKRVVEENQTIEVPVEREEIYVERRPVNEELTDSSVEGGSRLGTDAYQEGDSIHIPLTEERVNVSKTDVVSEEIIVGKRKVQDTEVVNETVRREEADIDDDRDLGTDDFDRNRTNRR